MRTMEQLQATTTGPRRTPEERSKDLPQPSERFWARAKAIELRRAKSSNGHLGTEVTLAARAPRSL